MVDNSDILHPRPEKGDGTINVSLAVPVSSDGYFIATAHGVGSDEGVMALLYKNQIPVSVTREDNLDGDPSHLMLSGQNPFKMDFQPQLVADISSVKLRIVATYPSKDLALLKAPFATPEYFNIRKHGAKEDENISYTLNPLSTENIGSVNAPIYMVENDESNNKIYWIRSDISYGDSGAGIFDAKSQLLGIAISVTQDEKTGLDFIKAASLDKKIIDKAIAADRISNGVHN